VLVTKRVASFDYNTLVSDMRALPILARTTGVPVVFDAIHSVQEPGGKGTSSGAEREFTSVLARVAVGVHPGSYAVGRSQHGAAARVQRSGADADGVRRTRRKHGVMMPRTRLRPQ
jgi:3-deoxy-D-manno-octulosonic acid (KDO) 8-phosphate synthase